MSSKLKLKSTAGGSLSLIVDDTLATDETMNISDGGIVNGSNANGSYTKFPDGTLICRHSSTGFTTETLVGSLYTVATAATWTFPHAFIETPNISASSSSTSYTWFVAQGIGVTSASIRAWRATSNAVSLTAQYQAIGRWK